MKCANWVCAVVLAFGFGTVQAIDVVDARDRVARPAPPTRVTDQPTAILSALKQNDFAALLEATEDKGIDELAKRWNDEVDSRLERQAKRASEDVHPEIEEINARNDEKSQQLWGKLQSSEGVDALVDEFQPKVAEAVSKHLLSFNLGFGAMLTSIASDQKMSAEEVQQLTQLMIAVQNWTGRVDFADRERLRRAITAVSKLAQQTRLKRFDDVQLLRFEDAIVHGDALIATIKQVLAIYEVDADQILNSVRLSEVDAFGDAATLRAQARVFGVDLSQDFRMRYYDDEWIPAEYAEVRERMQPEVDEAKAAAEQAAAAAAAAAKPMQRGAKQAKRASSGNCGAGAEFDIEIDAATAKSAAKQTK